MKNRLLLCFLLCSALLLRAQDDDPINRILDQEPVYTNEFSLMKAEPNQIILSMDFGSAAIRNRENLRLIKGKIVTQVQVVYSRFSIAEQFDQRELNYRRLDRLGIYAPWLYESNLIEWNMVEQLGATNLEEAKRLFHGIVITFRPASSPAVANEEIAYLRELIAASDVEGTKKFEEMVSKIKNAGDLLRYMQFEQNKDTSWISKGECGTVKASFEYGQHYEVINIKIEESDNEALSEKVKYMLSHMPPWYFGLRESYQRQKRFTIPFVFACDSGRMYIPRYEANDPEDRFFNPDFIPPSPTRGELEKMEFKDSTILRVFDRHPEWENMLLICDLTGSMSSYTAQMLYWLQSNLGTGKVKAITFFNDGDNKDDKNKTAGYVGGVYTTFSQNFDTIAELALMVMKKGQGGDVSENNVEAILKGMAQCGACENAVMIADNFATPRDMVLMDEIKSEVKIILCGARGGTNTDYLDFVRRNKGSLHLEEQDFVSLHSMGENQQLKIGRKKYAIKGGRFQPVKQ